MSDPLPVEDVVHVRSRTWAFYLVLIFAVAPIASTVPAAWVYALWVLSTHSLWHLSPLYQTLFLISVVEVLFSLYHVSLVRAANKTSLVPAGDMQELQRVFQRILKTGLADLDVDEETLDNTDRPGSPEEDIVQLERNDPRAVDFRNSLRTWFNSGNERCAWSSIHLNAIHKWLYWAMFSENLPGDVPRHRKVFLDDAVDLLEKRSGCKIPSEPSDVAPFLLTLDPLEVIPRPFWWYAMVGIINLGMVKYLETFHRARRGHSDGLEYLLRVPEDWDATGPRPICFVHGLGLGLFQYANFLTGLLDAVQDRPILILLQPHISQNFFHPKFLQPLNREETGRVLASIFLSLGWITPESLRRDIDPLEKREYDKQNIPSGVTFLSHSNGSYTHTWMCKDFPGVIHRSAFIDPTSFVLSEGDVCYNFLYRPAKTSIELIMRYFVGTELGVRFCLQRRFQWTSNNLWFEEIPHARDPSKALFVLGGKDDIVNAERVKRYLSYHGIKKGLWYDDSARHGQALIGGGETHQRILEWLQQD